MVACSWRYISGHKNLDATIEAIAGALKDWENTDYAATVVIDSLPWALETEIAVKLRRVGARIGKVRGLADEKEPLIRLADALCGLARAARYGQEDMQELLDWGVKTGVIRLLSEGH
jgi:hypothetical protein